MSILDFFTREAGQERRRALEGLLTQFIPPEIRPQLGLLAEANPVVSMERAGQDAETLFAPDQSLMDRLAAGGRMASNMAGVVAPAIVAGRAGVPVANAVAETLTGLSMTPQAAALRDFGADEFGGVGFRAYHGSPHDFDRFSMSKIGTGEGAQAYGHGLYFAENENIARSYRDALSPNRVAVDGRIVDSPVTQAAAKFSPNPDDYIKALTVARERAARNLESTTSDPELGDLMADLYRSEISDIDAKIAELRPLSGGWFHTKPDGRMYEVQINADPNDFLDWDKPLSEQPQGVLDALRRNYGDARLQRMIDQSYSGGDIAQRVENKLYADEMAQSGLPGIKYLDAGSRGAGDGSRNYVVFDDKLIDIVRKYGIAGAAAMLGVSALDVEQAMAQGQQQPQGLLSGAQ